MLRSPHVRRTYDVIDDNGRVNPAMKRYLVELAHKQPDAESTNEVLAAADPAVALALAEGEQTTTVRAGRVPVMEVASAAPSQPAPSQPATETAAERATGPDAPEPRDAGSSVWSRPWAQSAMGW